MDNILITLILLFSLIFGPGQLLFLIIEKIQLKTYGIILPTDETARIINYFFTQFLISIKFDNLHLRLFQF